MSSSRPSLQRRKSGPSRLPFICPSTRDSGISVSPSPSSLPPRPLRPQSKSLNDLRPDLLITFPIPFSLERDLSSAFNAWTPLWKSVHKSAALTFQIDTIPSLRCFNEAARSFNQLVVRLRGNLGLTEFTYEYDVWKKEDIKKFPMQDGVTAMFIVQSAAGLLDEVGAKLGDFRRAKKSMLRTCTTGSWYLYKKQQGSLGEKLPAWAYAMEGHGRELSGILATNGIVMEDRLKDLNVIGGLMGWEGPIPIKTPTWAHNLSLRTKLAAENVASSLSLHETVMGMPFLQKTRYKILKACFSKPGREQDRIRAAEAFKKLHAKLEASKSTSTGTILLTKKVQTMIWRYEYVPLEEEEEKEEETDSEEMNLASDADDDEDSDCVSVTSELVNYKGPVVRAMTEGVARQLDAAGVAAQARRPQQHSRLPPIDEHGAFEKFAGLQTPGSAPSQQTRERSYSTPGEQHIVDCGSSCYSRSEYSLKQTDTGISSPCVSSSSIRLLVANPYEDQAIGEDAGQSVSKRYSQSPEDSAPFIPARSQRRLHR